jgi:hypothetical protein
MIGSASRSGGSSTTSWQGPLRTVFGRESASDLSLPRARIFSPMPSGGVISSTPWMRCAQLVQRLDAECHAGAPLGAELVDQAAAASCP